MDLLQAAPFQNMYPRPFVKEDQSAEIVMQQMDQQYAPLHLVSMVSKHGTQLQAANAKDSDLLTKERLCRALSMFEVVMQRIKGFLMKDEQVNFHLKKIFGCLFPRAIKCVNCYPQKKNFCCLLSILLWIPFTILLGVVWASAS